MKKNRISVRFIASFMAFIVALVAMPLQAIAQGFEKTELIESATNNNSIDETVNEREQDIFIVEEDLSKRGQFEKHYLCSDGTFVSVTYPEAIHYLDENDQWKDVDQSLTYDSASDMYISGKAGFDVSFSNKASADNIARIERNGYTLSWGIQMSKKNEDALSLSGISANNSINSNVDVILMPSPSASAIIDNFIDNKKTEITDCLVTNSDTFVLPNISSQISYSNIFDETQNVSLKYTVYHNKIEEDIIISERGDLQSVSMNMDVGPLTPIVNADGSVDLVDANYEMQFHIGIPYMVDAECGVCNDILVTAAKNGTSCIITYTPNTEWFESSERVFPILLDPSITTNDYVSNIEDTYVEQNTTTNHSSEQYLYFTPNSANGNRRNIIVRVTKLPEIDASMPIISAKLTLTAQYAPFSDISLKAGYLDTGLELFEYDYSITTSDYYSYTAYSYLNTGSTQVTFDFSSHIYEMYGDLAFDQEHDYDYHGDFVIGYSNDSDTTFSYPLYSVEYTTPANRPVFTVKYGYTLPAGILDGGIYSFRNVASFSYMTVNGMSPANNSNIYQVDNDDDIATMTQKFKLEYVASTGGYRLRAMSSSLGTDKVVDIQRAGGAIYSGRNVQIYSATDPISQEWLIVPIDYNIFKIVPRANMSLGLTTYGCDDGTNAGTSSTSQGNIFVQTLVPNNSHQEWLIYDNNNNEVNTARFRAEIETGNYFLANYFTGRYLHRTGNVVNGMSGRISSLGEETVKWQIVNLGDGYCTIQRSDAPHYYLAPTGTTSGSGVRAYSSVSETIPDNYRWSLRTASGDGFIIQHKTSGLYLSGISSTANPSSVCIYALNTSGTDAYFKQVWRVANENDYVELGVGVSFNDIAIDINDSQGASINKSPRSAWWASYTDFDYSISGAGSQYVSYNSSTHKFTGVEVGTATVTAIHKTTGISRSFNVKVNNNAIIIVPGILGSELYVGSGNPYFSEHMPLFSEEIIDGLSTIQDGETVQDLIPSVWWEYVTNIPSILRLYNAWSDSMSCNDNGSSKYNVYVKEYRSADSTTRTNNHCGTGDAYLTLYNKLVATYSNEYSIDLFSYDWRLSNAVSASKLNDYIEYYNYDKVILIAHSMGGLVASGYLGMGTDQRAKVEQVFYLASPLLGAPTVANVWYNEDISFVESAISDAFGISVEDFKSVYRFITGIADPIENLICNYASIYELFPSKYYFQLTGSSYMSNSFTTIMIGGGTTVTECSTYAATKNILTGYFDDFNPALMAIAEAFHDTTFISGRHVSSYVDARYYYCKNDSFATTSHLKFYQVVSSTSYSTGLEVDGTTNDGDSLVLITSATLANMYPRKCSYFPGDHMTLATTSAGIDQWISNIS